MIGILTLLFSIVKLIGIVILSLIIIAFFLILFVLLSKIRYDILLVKKTEDFDLMSASGKIKVSWLCHILNFKLDFQEKNLKYIVTVFGKKILADKISIGNKEEENKENDKDISKEAITDNINKEEIKNDENLVDEKVKKTKASKKNKNSKVKKSKQNKEEPNLSQEEEEPSKKSKDKKDKKDKKETENIALVYLKDIAVMKKIFRSIKKVLSKLRPEQFSLKWVIGMEDPSLTGKIVGVCYTLKGVTGLDIDTCGDFQRQIIKGKLFIKGSFSIWGLISPLLWIIKHEIMRRLKKIKHRLQNYLKSRMFALKKVIIKD